VAEYFETEEITKGYDSKVARRIMGYMRPYRLKAFLALAALALSTLGEIFLPVLSQRIVDRALMPSFRRVRADSGLDGAKTGGATRIGDWAYLRAGALKSLSAKETAALEARGELDPEDWYVASEAPSAGKTLDAIALRGIGVERGGGEFAIGRKALIALPAKEALAIRSDDLRYLSAGGALFLAALLVILGSTFVQTWYSNLIGQLVMKDMRLDLFRKTSGQSLAFLGRHPVGRLVTRMTSDVETINEFFTSVVIAFMKDLSVMAGVIGAFFLLDPGLALVAALSLPPVAALASVGRVKARDAFRRQRTWLSKVNAFLSEHLSGAAVVKLFAREEASAREFGEKNGELLRAGLGEMRVYATFRPLVDFLGSTSTAVVIWAGAKFLLGGGISLGTLIAFINLIRMFYSPVQDIAEKYTILQSAMAGGERVFKLLDADEAIPDEAMERSRRNEPPADAASCRGDVEFRGVHFSYKEGEPVIRDLSFSVRAGETVAIVGYTGAGKTTIANLITRMWDRDSGDILLDGRDVRDYPLAALRSSIQPVPQDVFLFSGSVRDNIALGVPMDDEKVRAAARAVGAEEFILTLPGGYEASLSEGAANISSGQRQLISFARAVAQDPRVIILDEATSSVDTETERLIQRGLEGLLAGRTSIVIAHRLSTIRHADRILVLSRGRLVEEGSHDELVAKRGIYWNLYRLQYGSA
jgi:ATP-binding cassette, subfamily B, multidrug efflux pump